MEAARHRDGRILWNKDFQIVPCENKHSFDRYSSFGHKSYDRRVGNECEITGVHVTDWLIFIAFGSIYSLFVRVRLSNITLSKDYLDWGGIRFLKSDIASIESTSCATSFGRGINRVLEIRFVNPKKYHELVFHKFFRNMICKADLAIEVEWYEDSAGTIQMTILNWFGKSLTDN